MDQLELAPVHRIEGEVSLPGSKSLTNRALLLSALAAGTTRLHNPLSSDDTLRMMAALRQMNVTLSASEDGRFIDVVGNGGLFTPPSESRFLLGNAGTAIRPLTALLSLMPGEYELDGDAYMRERPIAHLIDALKQLGARIDYLAREGYPPIRVHGGTLSAGEVEIAGNISSQYLTSLLMTLPLLPADSQIRVTGEQVSKPYLDITLGIMAQFGVGIDHDNYSLFRVPGSQIYQSPGTYLVEGDASSASYFFAAAAIAGEVTVHGLGEHSVQGDIQFLDTIAQMGAQVQRYADRVTVRAGKLHGVDVDLNHIPDAAMTIAVAALFAEGPTTIRNVFNWRVKETDRMTAMATELRKLGATVNTTEDSISITPPQQLTPAVIDTYGDHRIAMCFSLAALGTVVTINDPDCTKKTFPDYFSVFSSVCAD